MDVAPSETDDPPADGGEARPGVSTQSRRHLGLHPAGREDRRAALLAAITTAAATDQGKPIAAVIGAFRERHSLLPAADTLDRIGRAGRAVARKRMASRPRISLLVLARISILPRMFVVTEEAAAAIRTAYEQEGELSATIEVRRLFPGITDNVRARESGRTIANWTSLPTTACQITPLRLRRSRARPAKP